MVIDPRFFTLQILIMIALPGCQSDGDKSTANYAGNPFANGFYRAGNVTENFTSETTRTGTAVLDVEKYRIEDTYSDTTGWSNFIVYQHDEQGRLLSRDSRNSRKTTYQYNVNGLPTTELRNYRNGRTRRTEYKWNSHGRLIQSNEYRYNPTGVLTYNVQYNYEFDEEQRLTRRDCKDIKNSGRPCSTALYTVDDKKRIIERRLFNSQNQQLLERRVFNYDKQGNLSKREYYNSDGRLLARSVISFKKSFTPVVNRYLFKYSIDP